MALFRNLTCIAAAAFLIAAAPFAPPKIGARTIYRHATLIRLCSTCSRVRTLR